MLDKTPEKIRKCSSCSRFLALSNYYTKGSRYDAACKRCVRKKKKEHRRRIRPSRVGISQIKFDRSRIIIRPYEGQAPAMSEISRVLNELVMEVFVCGSRRSKVQSKGKSYEV
jgi:hypothetical protein